MIAEYWKTAFRLDGIPGMAFGGYTNGNNWNGWECPYFDKDTAERILRASEQNGYSWEYDIAQDTYTVSHRDDEKGWGPEMFCAVKIVMGEESIRVYGIGAYSWVWEIAE